MPALDPLPRQTPASLSAGKVPCPRCGQRFLNPTTLRCLCSAEFTTAGLAHWRTLPAREALRS